MFNKYLARGPTLALAIIASFIIGFSVVAWEPSSAPTHQSTVVNHVTLSFVTTATSIANPGEASATAIAHSAIATIAPGTSGAFAGIAGVLSILLMAALVATGYGVLRYQRSFGMQRRISKRFGAPMLRTVQFDSTSSSDSGRASVLATH